MSDDDPDTREDDSDRREDDPAQSEPDDFGFPASDRDDVEADDSNEQAAEPAAETPDDATDPFERLDGPDRPPGGDPFAEIDETAPEQAPDRSSFDTLGFEQTGEDSHESDPEPTTDASAEATPGESAAEDPFDRLGGQRRQGDPFEGLGETARDPATSAETDDDLWENLSRSAAEPETETRGERRFAEVDKHSYCENCEYFSEPPDVECAHEGTNIVEFVDYETVRVADCPVVVEREELAEMDDER
ncbi:hypothetical protein Huta_2364 [Halorhabdus utahensis DSM 12940]|uniref:DUF8135 domain-containing protein n=1 Tax=Halorhabdus utahensis (strain DSM 12940 / JCM 11049 / AX-2) TaxID=519442 RepID=C7NVK7_HALUD|nr:hypothetical protein [Halorhabdus utahensis]ACV12530.1 hypothetical protein Huta_2364 [Halorhabdus utahensis DSM 12940]